MNLNTIEYAVQAKCYAINNKVGPRDIRDFRGSKTDMSVRKIFITTSDYTKGAIEEAYDTNQPVTLINGSQLIDFCKSHGDMMFDIKYYFNVDKLNDLFLDEENDINKDDIKTIERRITKNDVRARILRIPSEYKNLIQSKSKYKISINGETYKDYNISSDKSYFGGVTKHYKDFISNVDFEEGQSIWNYDEKNDVFNVIIK